MGSKQRREREKEALRQDILDAARELFVHEGYENVSMRRVAEKIEYSPTTIYLYFEDKASLLYAICEETFAGLCKRMETIRKAGDDPVESLRRGCRAYVDFGLQYPNHYKLTFINHPQHPRDEKRQLREESMGMKAYGNLRAGVEACIKAKQFRETNVEAVTQMMWAGGHGITSLLISMPDFPWVNKDELIDLMIDTLIDGLRA
ncbi:MAG TPA: TetR/AcrR family transcriptional regulator [Blastocatellia bacterium]|nr:TetR/AcrR family transcriptional regulator [Blastocatellia bacterium]